MKIAHEISSSIYLLSNNYLKGYLLGLLNKNNINLSKRLIHKMILKIFLQENNNCCDNNKNKLQKVEYMLFRRFIIESGLEVDWQKKKKVQLISKLMVDHLHH